MERKKVLIVGCKKIVNIFLTSLKQKNKFTTLNDIYDTRVFFDEKNIMISYIDVSNDSNLRDYIINYICDSVNIDYIIYFVTKDNLSTIGKYEINGKEIPFTTQLEKPTPYIINFSQLYFIGGVTIDFDAPHILNNGQGVCWYLINYIFKCNVFDDDESQITNENNKLENTQDETLNVSQKLNPIDCETKDENTMNTRSVTKLIELGAKTVTAEEIRYQKLVGFINQCYDQMIVAEKEYYMVSLNYLSLESRKIVAIYFEYHGFTCELCDGDKNLLIKY